MDKAVIQIEIVGTSRHIVDSYDNDSIDWIEILSQLPILNHKWYISIKNYYDHIPNLPHATVINGDKK